MKLSFCGVFAWNKTFAFQGERGLDKEDPDADGLVHQEPRDGSQKRLKKSRGPG